MIRQGLLCILFILFAHFSRAQQWLGQPIDFAATNQPLAQVLLQLSETADVGISFRSEIIPENALITVQAENQSLKQVLQQCLTNTGLTFKTTKRTIQVVRIEDLRYTISGYVKDSATGESLPLANVWCQQNSLGVSTNNYGFFSLDFPPGVYDIQFSYLGYQRISVPIDLRKNQTIEVQLEPSLTLTEILVVDRDSTAAPLPLAVGKTAIQQRHLHNTPALGGEADLIRLIQRQVGVQTGADGLGGMFVRGGSPDQNLILLDDIPIFQPSHSLGLFSVINPQVIRSAQFEKGAFSAKYGGRLSSVLDIRSKEGNTHHSNYEFETGTFATKILAELPIKENQSALLLSARRTHLDPWLRSTSRTTKEINLESGETNYYFYDLNLKFHSTLSPKDRIFLSAYQGNDFYENETESEFFFTDENNEEGFQSDSLYQALEWSNSATALRWNHEFNPQLFANTTLTYSRFQYRSENSWFIEEERMTGEESYIDFFQFQSIINDFRIKTDFDFYYSPQHHFRFGADWLQRGFKPGALEGFVLTDQVDIDALAPEIEEWFSRSDFQANELNFYVEDQIQWSDKWELDLGVRVVGYQHEDYQHVSAQPRMRLAYSANKNTVFLGLGQTRQYLHLLTFSGAGLPTDLWVPATSLHGPQSATLAEIGWTIREKNSLPAIGLSVYYKHMNGLLSYLDEAELPTLQEGTADYWEDVVSNGTGWSYGFEFQAQKNWGSSFSQISYTYQQSKREFGEINGGQSFDYTFERPHKITFDTRLTLSPRWSFLLGWEYSSGRPITLLASDSQFDPLSNFAIPFVEERSATNAYRLPDYHRLDFTFRYLLEKNRATHDFQLGLYNAYNRYNVYYAYEYVDEYFPEDSGLQEEQSLPLIPTFSYRLQFTGR